MHFMLGYSTYTSNILYNICRYNMVDRTRAKIRVTDFRHWGINIHSMSYIENRKTCTKELKRGFKT